MKQQIPQDIITDTIIERPILFSVDGRTFTMHPVTLGKSLIISSLVSKLGIDRDLLALEPVAETMRLASLQKELSARIIAVACAKGKQVFDTRTENWVKFFMGISTEDRASLLNAALSYDRTQSLMAHYGIDTEMDNLHKAMDARKEGSDLTFCGKSMWGQIIDPMCERYGWTMDYILWGISYTNLQMLLADHVKTVFLTDEERKKVHLPRRGNHVFMADSMTEEEMKKVLGIR